MTTVSAVVRLMPRPPARVESKKTKSLSASPFPAELLKASMRACRSEALVLPSSRW